ncbi:hypothetical protein LINPERHAP1_LOCUS14146 [Linum perenne]
MDIPT